MGYNYSADLIFRIPDASTVAMSLDMNRLHDELAANPSAWGLPQGAFDRQGIVAGLFSALDFEINESWADTTMDTTGALAPITVYNGYVSTKLNTMVDIVLSWMASHGVGMDIDARGEDDAMWRWRSDVFSGQFRNETLITITQDELARLKAVDALVTRLHGIAEHTPAFPIADALIQEAPPAVPGR